MSEEPFNMDKMMGFHQQIEARKQRAKRRHEQRPEKGWCFAIIGHAIPAPDYAFAGGLAVLRSVEETPGEIELAAALRDKSLMSSVGRYSYLATAELFVRDVGKPDFIFDFGWWLISLLRVKSLSDFLVPMVANHSWAVIGGLESDSCEVRFLEDYPKARKIEEAKQITMEDCEWAERNLESFIRLLEVPNFRLAVDALTTHHFQANDRMMVAMLWAALDALFSIDSELTFRLSLCVAITLEPPGEERSKLFSQMKKLYRVRGKAVHGQALSVEAIQAHTIQVRQILSRLLCRFVEGNQVKTAAIIEEEILLGTPGVRMASEDSS